MSTLHHESLLETCYDEAWIDYATKNNLTHDELYAMEQNSELGYIMAIVEDAEKRFSELCV
tara:strand:- start:773 stop:955 length:183 start_codon:yes stop_codon:yes gene_type:complete